jgi:hypothetical protein
MTYHREWNELRQAIERECEGKTPLQCRMIVLGARIAAAQFREMLSVYGQTVLEARRK